MLASIPFLYLHTKSELAPPEDQGFLFGITKGPQYANLDYMNYYGAQLDDVFASFPENDPRFVINGLHARPRILRLRPEAMGRAAALGAGYPAAAAERSSSHRRQRLLRLAAAPARQLAGLPVQMVISSTQDHRSVYEVMERIKDAARKSGMFIVVDSDLDFNHPVSAVMSIARRHTISASPCKRSAIPWR